MRFSVWPLILLSVAVTGCGQGHPKKQAENLNTDTFTVSEADALLAQPPAQTSQAAVQPQPGTNIVVNNEAGPLAEPAAVEAAADDPDDKRIQQALKNLGLYRGEIDGKIGPKTKEAIKEFQRSKNLVEDGKVGPKTWALLKEALEPAIKN